MVSYAKLCPKYLSLRIFLILFLCISTFSKQTIANDFSRGAESLIRGLISPPTEQRQGITPLMEAAKKGDVKKISQLISSGANIEARSQYDYTPIVFASWHGHKEAVITLLNAGANPNVVTKRITKNTQGPTPSYTPLYAALSQIDFIPIDTYTKPSEEDGKSQRSKIYEEIANILITQGAKPDIKSIAQASRLGMLDLIQQMYESRLRFDENYPEQYGENINIDNDFFNRNPRDLYLETPICAAARSGNIETVKWLISKNADPDLCHSLSAAETIEITKLLLKNGANPNQNLESTIQALAFVDYGNKNIELLLQKLSLYKHHGANTNIILANPPNVRHKNDPSNTKYKNLTIKEFLIKIKDKMKNALRDSKRTRAEFPDRPHYGPSDAQYMKTIENIDKAYEILYKTE